MKNWVLPAGFSIFLGLFSAASWLMLFFIGLATQLVVLSAGVVGGFGLVLIGLLIVSGRDWAKKTYPVGLGVIFILMLFQIEIYYRNGMLAQLVTSILLVVLVGVFLFRKR